MGISVLSLDTCQLLKSENKKGKLDALSMSEVRDEEVHSLILLLRGIKRSLSFYRAGDFRFQGCCWRSWVLSEHTCT